MKQVSDEDVNLLHVFCLSAVWRSVFFQYKKNVHAENFNFFWHK